MIADPPLLLTLAESATCVWPAVTVGLPGAAGGDPTVTVSDCCDTAPLPMVLTARTLKLYVPLVRPVTVWEALLGQVLSLDVTQMSVQSPSFCWYSHSVIGDPPLPRDVQVSVTDLSLSVAVGLAGLEGVVNTSVLKLLMANGTPLHALLVNAWAW